MGRNVTYTLNLNSNVNSVLAQNESAALRMDGVMQNLNNTMRMFGLGFAGAAVISAGKDWLKGAEDYELAMLRIKNASYNAGEGLKNQLFIGDQVSKLKIDLQSSADAYGDFLFKIRNAQLSGDTIRHLHQNILEIAKIGGLSEGQMVAPVKDIAIMLGEGVLEARHLRMLSYVMPQLIPFLAKDLGLGGAGESALGAPGGNDDNSAGTVELSRLMSRGKLTKAGVPSGIIIQAIQELRDSLGDSKLNETLHTLNSELTDLNNKWLIFKNDTTLDNKPELVGFFNELKDGIHWLSEHEEGIIRTGKAILNVAEAYAIWRLSLVALQAPSAIASLFTNEQKRLTDVLGLYAPKVNEVAINNEILKQSTTKLEQAEIEENVILKEKITQLDLLTNAQITNIASTEKLIEVEHGLMWNEGTLFRGFGYGEGNATSSGVNKYKSVTEDALLTIQAEELTMRGNLSLEEAGTAQALLFSDAQMAAAKSTGVLSSELLLLNEQMANTSLAMSSETIGAGGIIGLGSAGSVGEKGLFGRLGAAAGGFIMPVFISGMAMEVANQLVPGNKVTHEGLSASHWWNTLTNLLPFVPTAGNGDGLGDYGKKLGVNEAVQKILDFNYGGRDLMYGKKLSKIKSEGDDLYYILTKEQEYLDKNGINYNLLDLVDPADEHGNRKTDNASLFSLFQRAGFTFHEFLDNVSYGGGIGSGGGKVKIPDLSKDTTHIRGNSSNYVTINIHEMNGVKSSTFKLESTGNGIDDKKLLEVVGTNLVKILTGVVNDSQLVGRHH